MKMSDLHLEVLEMMERIRAKIGLCYGVRVQKSQRALDGYVFLGNESYIWVPICPLPIPENKTRAVGIVFRVEGGELTESWIEFAIPKHQSKVGAIAPGVIPVLKSLTSGAHAQQMRWYERFSIPLSANVHTTKAVVQQTEKAVLARLPAILKVLTAKRMSFPRNVSTYDKTKMKKDLLKLMSARSGLADATNRRLSNVANSL